LFAQIEASEHEGEEVSTWQAPQRLLLLNKVDRLKDNRDLVVWQRKAAIALPICAKGDGLASGVARDGLAQLTAVARDVARGEQQELIITMPLQDAKAISLLERQALIVSRDYDMNAAVPLLKVRAKIGTRQLATIQSACPSMTAKTLRGKAVVLPKINADASKPGWG
jgi:50S ribosomal subunit-associated GTPase HflX